MATSIASSLGVLASLLAVLPPGAGAADPFKDFGALSGLAIALDVINTVVVLFFLARILFRKA